MTDLPPDFFNRPLAEVDPDIAAVLDHELERQQRTLEMIASENFVPQAILEAQGSVLTNKYAEGYPGKRYYGGCEHVDVAEQLAIDRAKELFGAEHANVQPHSGAQANSAVYMALLDGLVAAEQHPNPVPYCDVVTTTTHKTLGGARGGMILCREEFAKKINSRVFPGHQGGPLMHVIAGKAVALKVAQSDLFRERQARTREGAALVAEEMVAADVNVLTGGTDVHLVLADLRDSELDGQQAEDRLHEIGITVNRNAVPFDPRPPAVSSGLRVGSPALATRGLQVDDFTEVGTIIATALTADWNASLKGELSD